ncbi:MAG: nuclear transport factor 2 family protein [Polyangiales bacterium]
MSLDLSDRLTLHELLARLDHAVDAQDWDGYLSHFDPAAVMDPGFAPPVHGRDAIRAFLLASEGNTRGKRHVASNVYIDGAGDEAVAHSYLVVIEREDIPKVIATARIVDTFARRDGRWRVVRHQVSVDPGMFKAFQG